MIVWLNGAFGVGKTTTARRLDRSTGWRVFDPEHVGYLLRSNMADVEVDDFQDLAPWRTLVPIVADEILRSTGSPAMVAVQTVLVEDYWAELLAGFERRGRPVFHVLLDGEIPALQRRIDEDREESQAKDWRRDHLGRFTDARPWLSRSADLVVDTTTIGPDEVATRIVDAVSSVEVAGS